MEYNIIDSGTTLESNKVPSSLTFNTYLKIRLGGSTRSITRIRRDNLDPKMMALHISYWVTKISRTNVSNILIIISNVYCKEVL